MFVNNSNKTVVNLNDRQGTDTVKNVKFRGFLLRVIKHPIKFTQFIKARLSESNNKPFVAEKLDNQNQRNLVKKVQFLMNEFVSHLESSTPFSEKTDILKSQNDVESNVESAEKAAIPEDADVTSEKEDEKVSEVNEEKEISELEEASESEEAIEDVSESEEDLDDVFQAILAKDKEVISEYSFLTLARVYKAVDKILDDKLKVPKVNYKDYINRKDKLLVLRRIENTYLGASEAQKELFNKESVKFSDLEKLEEKLSSVSVSFSLNYSLMGKEVKAIEILSNPASNKGTIPENLSSSDKKIVAEFLERLITDSSLDKLAQLQTLASFPSTFDKNTLARLLDVAHLSAFSHYKNSFNISKKHWLNAAEELKNGKKPGEFISFLSPEEYLNVITKVIDTNESLKFYETWIENQEGDFAYLSKAATELVEAHNQMKEIFKEHNINLHEMHYFLINPTIGKYDEKLKTPAVLDYNKVLDLQAYFEVMQQYENFVTWQAKNLDKFSPEFILQPLSFNLPKAYENFLKSKVVISEERDVIPVKDMINFLAIAKSERGLLSPETH